MSYRIADNMMTASGARWLRRYRSSKGPFPVIFITKALRLGRLRRLNAVQGGGGQHAAEAHRLDGGRGHDDHGAALLDGLVEHVHGAEVHGHGVVLVSEGGLSETLRDFGFGEAQDRAGA